ncbi:hypothetical protein ACIQ34_08235 [Ureibacillus sp. NPDC094379]
MKTDLAECQMKKGLHTPDEDRFSSEPNEKGLHTPDEDRFSSEPNEKRSSYPG